MKCLIIDDERPARELMEDNISMVPFLELAGSCKNAEEAMKIMESQVVDLIFLDIQMPGLSGLQLLQSGLIEAPMVILVTAYEHYALEGFNLNVLDYLVKPVPFERFLKAVTKARELYLLKNKVTVADVAADQNYLWVNSDYSLVRINIDHITHIEGLKDYIKIYQLHTDKPVIPRLTLHYMEEKLPADKFMRVHRSFIVALDKIQLVKKNRLYVPKAEVPFTDSYREQLMKYIGGS